MLVNFYLIDSTIHIYINVITITIYKLQYELGPFSKNGLGKNINSPFLLLIRPPKQFPVWRSDKQRKTAIIRLIIFGLSDPSQSGPPPLYTFNHLPPLIF